MPLTQSVNPLLDRSDVPRFDLIHDTQVLPAIEACIVELDHAIAHAVDRDTEPTWEHLLRPLDLAVESLNYTWDLISHLAGVADSAALRIAQGHCMGPLSAALAHLRQHPGLLQRYRAIEASGAFSALPAARRKIIGNLIRDARLAGSELPPDAQHRLVQLREHQAMLMKTFHENVSDATDAFSLTVTDSTELTGLSSTALAAARNAAANNGDDREQSYRLTLDYPCYSSVMRLAGHRPLREAMYRARTSRASEFGPKYANGAQAWDNLPVMDALLEVRHHEAELLGFRNFATLSLTQKMAQSPESALAFLEDLSERIRPRAQREWQALQEFATTTLGLDELRPWDVMFAAEKMREAQFDFSMESVKPYFPEHAVLRGLFGLVENLFDVTFHEDGRSTWHSDVRTFQLLDRRGNLIAHLYLDLYARQGKREGAWATSGGSRGTRADGSIRPPVAYLMCNIAPPASGEPACFAFEELITLFHEMGHCLHHMLTTVDDSAVSGANGVEWDAIEFPSQFMENFCWEWDVIATLSAHVQTQRPLPRDLFERMQAARNFNKAMETAHQISLSALDIYLHSGYAATSDYSIDEWARIIHERFDVTPWDLYSRSLNTFTHIFAGAYAAGYYSYQWAQVLATDAYAALEEAQAQHGEAGRRRVGARYRNEILAPGGSRPAMESFIAFRGRKPGMDALLKRYHMGD